KPAEEQQDEAGQPLEVADGETARRARSSEPDEVLATDIRSKQTRTDRQPTHISARQEEVGADVLLPFCGPPGDCRQEEEVPADNDDVDDTKVAHGVRSVAESGRPKLRPSWLLIRVAQNLRLLVFERYATRGNCKGRL